MSAICGVVGLDGRPWSEADLGGVVRTLTPLGPNGGGGWSGTAGGCGVAMAAVLRWSTPEDSADRQPALRADGSLVLVGDLRVDNRAELAPRLGLSDDTSVPDSAFVLAAYERWGDALPDRVIGEFALAIVDRRRGGVLLARDHGGMRPLVVHERRGVVAFASTALALTALDGVGHRLDVARAAEALALLPSERTLVEGIRWLPAGTAAWVSASGVRQWSWWRPDAHEVVDLGSPAAYERELREALDAAVTARLRSRGRVGVSLSGGLDSTSVAATAALLRAPESLPTYTSAPPPGWRDAGRPDSDADESPLVMKLAERHPNIQPSFIHLPREGNLLGSHDPLWELGSGPVRHTFNWLWISAIRSRARADGVTAVLSGSRGNLYFSADGPGWLAALIRARRLRTAWAETAAWVTKSGAGPLRAAISHIGYPLLPDAVRRHGPRRTAAIRDWAASSPLRPDVLAELRLPERVPMLEPGRERDAQAASFWTIQSFAEQADAEAAAHALTGVEERDPTGDRRVIEVALRQPEWIRRRDGLTRAVARGAMAERLPTEIVGRTRHGEQLPDWLDLMTAVRDELADDLDQLKHHPTSRELIDSERLQGLLDHWPDRSARADPQVERDYRLVLARGLLVSRYLRWFERRSAGSLPSASAPASVST